MEGFPYRRTGPVRGPSNDENTPSRHGGRGTARRRRPYPRRRRAGRAGFSFVPLRATPLILLALLFSCLLVSLPSLKGVSKPPVTLSVLARGPGGEVPAPRAVEGEPEVAARAAVLLDPLTGEFLYRKNDGERLPMASTTKIMTALLVLERCSLDEKVIVGEEATGVGESSGWLTAGETLTVEQLLHALLLQSGNDAAMALAIHTGGSLEAFVDMMNKRAEELGAWDTHFANPHGLDQEGHYTTAHDLALIAAEAMRLEPFRRVVSTRKYELPWPGHPFPRVYYNKNKLLGLYPYANGIKTGYTLGAGRCLVASASRDGMDLISVVLNCDDYWNQSERLLEYGFRNFVRLHFHLDSLGLPLEVGKCPTGRATAGGHDIAVTVRRDRVNEYLLATGYYKSWIPYPARRGEEVGRLQVGPEGEGRDLSLELEKDVPAPGFLRRLWSCVGYGLGAAWRVVKFLLPGI